ncbi:MAG: hypothetical protein HKO56_01205 [Bacteroidia bacterium]|nr:DinB family protein [Bacteroidia bacterium]NNC84753.1 hypothetical protein [Bacteroidia bacterium]NNM15245.1 hypothetical protein [Bacteroidia bacterium]
MKPDLLVDFSKYNVWANKLIIKMVNEVGEESATKDIVSSFPSIFKTLLHILDAQVLWLHRMQHDHFPEAPSKSFNGNLAQLVEELIASSVSLNNFVSEMTENDLLKELTYKNTSGKEYMSPFNEVILHCLNHSTFHRGQIITILRQLGFEDFVATDYVAYCRGSNPFN